MIVLKTIQEIEILHEANYMVHNVLDFLGEHINPGISTRELDNLALWRLSQWSEAIPTFKGYMGYPAAICISVNDEIVHGIPGDRILSDGDIVSIDFGVTHNGFVGDSARTFVVGTNSDEKTIKLINDTRLALNLGIKQMHVGNRLHDISRAIEGVAKENGYGNIKQFCGHGVGSKMHEEPKVLNYVNSLQENIHLQEGLVLALEPMFTLGSSDCTISKDGWTVTTSDKSLAVHWEVSVAVTKDGPRVLGNPDFINNGI